jgi:hypothetical protein
MSLQIKLIIFRKRISIREVLWILMINFNLLESAQKIRMKDRKSISNIWQRLCVRLKEMSKGKRKKRLQKPNRLICHRPKRISLRKKYWKFWINIELKSNKRFQEVISYRMKSVKKKVRLVIFQDWIFCKNLFLESNDQEWEVIYIFLKMKRDKVIRWIH